MFIRVDLPAPFSPSKAWISPRRTANSMPLLATTPGNRLTIPRISTAGAAPLPSRIVMAATSACPLSRLAGRGEWESAQTASRATDYQKGGLRGRRGNRVERDRLEGGQLLLVRRHRDRAVDDRLLIGGDGVEHFLRHRLVRVTEANALFRQTKRLLASLECSLDNLLRGQEEGGVNSLLRDPKLVLCAELALIRIGGDAPTSLAH